MLPFLKWAGGKRWLLNSHPEFFPATVSRYIEPFLGSGAVFFSLNPTSAILSDTNADLIDAYKAIKSDWREVYCQLEQHHFLHSKEYYYRTRSMRPRSLHAKAAQFIYLNRTCWNGLYRVNFKGEFNVPIGTKIQVLLDSDDYERTSQRLQSATLQVADFEVAIDLAGGGDFVFVDPPYTVRHNHNGFVKYNETLFSWSDQERLKRCLLRAKQRGARILVTNADHHSIRKLYGKDFIFRTASRSSVIAADADNRGRYRESIFST